MFSVLSGENLLLDWELNGEQPVRDVKMKTVPKYPHPTDHFPALLHVIIAKKRNGRNLKNTHPSTSTLHVSLFPPLWSRDLRRQSL